VGVALLATAEPKLPWESLASMVRAALEDMGLEWRESLPYPGRPQQRATIEIAPADPISLYLREGLLLVHASTTFGPGYHGRVVEVLDAISSVLDGGFTRVQDSTGYWNHRDEALLQRAFLRWAEGLWSGLQTGRSQVAVCLGLGRGPAEVPPDTVATPTGFRSREWIEKTSEGIRRALVEPGRRLSPAARDAFLWWHETPDAFDWIQLGRAVCTSDVIWRSLKGADAPTQVDARERAVSCFERALQLDPHGPTPLEELQRLYELLGRSQDAERIAARAAAEAHEPFRGGYRQGWIRRPLPGQWNVQLPGWLRAGCDGADGHDVFWDDRMTVHVTTTRRGRDFSAEEQATRHLEQLPADERERAQVEYLNGDVEGYLLTLLYGPEVPDVDSLVAGQFAAAGERVTFTVVARSPEASAMALRLGRSLRPLM
jgi:hypothetical protein